MCAGITGGGAVAGIDAVLVRHALVCGEERGERGLREDLVNVEDAYVVMLHVPHALLAQTAHEEHPVGAVLVRLHHKLQKPHHHLGAVVPLGELPGVGVGHYHRQHAALGFTVQ